jgi:hypothetical protein
MDMQQMMQQLLASQEKAEANSKTNKEKMLAEMSASMDVNTKEVNS